MRAYSAQQSNNGEDDTPRAVLHDLQYNGAAAPADATVASPGAPGTATGSVAQRDSAAVGYPDRAVLRMTKADLQNAPTFRYASDTRATTTAPGNRTSPPGTAAGTLISQSGALEFQRALDHPKRLLAAAAARA